MDNLIVVIATVYILNSISAFAPPTWMVLLFIGFNHPQLNPLSLALVAAFAATLGRITLAALSQSILRNKLLSSRTKENIDVLNSALERREKQTVGALLVYSFTPLPSNYLFIAYGLTTLLLNAYSGEFDHSVRWSCADFAKQSLILSATLDTSATDLRYCLPIK